jgi:proteasome lid subunit RPN8/RPN11
MELRSDFRYVAEASDREGRPLGEFPLVPDFGPIAEWTHLQGVRNGALPALAHHGPGAVEPVFDLALGRPFLGGIRVRFDAADPEQDPPTVPRSYFGQCVEQGAARLLHDGRLQAGASFVYRICAYPAARGRRITGATLWDEAEQGAAPLTLRHVDLATRLAHCTRLGQSAWNVADLPVLVHPGVLEEAIAMAQAAGEYETGGILVGHLHRDLASPELHLEITAQIPATQANAGHAHLGFTAETWSAVSAALALRKRNEMLLGWWHHHPHFCRACAPEKRRDCTLSRPFFSRADCELHRTVFDAAYSIALLLSDIGEDTLSCDWFGWRHGIVAARGCYLLPGSDISKPRALPGNGAQPVARVLNGQEEDHERRNRE